MIYHSETLGFQVLAVYRYRHPNGHFCVKERPFSSLSYRIGGRADFRIGGRLLAADPGCVAYIPSGFSFEVDYSDSDYFVIELESCTYREPEVILPQSPPEIGLLFSQLVGAWQRHRSVNGAKAAVYTILERLEREGKASLEQTPFARCLSDIEEHFGDPALSVADVCRRGFVSVSALRRAFAEQMGVSPMQYIIRLRMAKAVRLLVEGRLGVKEIAYSCGFSDEKYFSRAFKRIYGYPPSHLHGHSIL